MGYVYMVKAENMNMYKIGRSDSADARLKTLQAGSPVRLALIQSAYCENDANLERLLHDFVGDKRSHNEWFQLEESDAKAVLKILSNQHQAEEIIRKKKSLDLYVQGATLTTVYREIWGATGGRAYMNASKEFSRFISERILENEQERA